MKKLKFNKVIIWGHKLHSHTHSYVHESFYNAFKYMGYDVLWLDKNDNIDTINFDNCLFLTEGQVEQNIPINKSSKYILHNCNMKKYDGCDFVGLQVYTNDVLNYGFEKINEYTFIDNKTKSITQPWATDLLPHEFCDNNINFISNNIINWIGSYGGGEFGNENEINPFKESAFKDNKEFKIYGGFSNNLDRNNHINMIRSSFVAPAIVGKWQREKGYIPCRIFKNISYGHMGVTNSKKVNEIFSGELIYNEDTELLYQMYINEINNNTLVKKIEALMNITKKEHTYINRIEFILSVF